MRCTVDWSALASSTRDNVVPVEAALAAGLSARTLRRWDAEGGPLVRIESRALASVAAPVTWRTRVRAAVLQLGPPVAVARSTALRLRGLDVRDRDVHLTVPHGRRLPGLRQAAQVRVHRTRTWDVFADRLDDVDGLPVMPTARAVAETAAWFHRRDRRDARVSRRLVEAAVLAGAASMSEIVDEVARVGRVRGRADLRAAIEGLDPDVLATGSPPQVTLARSLAAAGVPPPVLEHPVAVGGVTRRLDLAWPDRRRAVEVDSVAHHLGTLRGSSDAARQWELEDVHGWRIRRVYTWQLQDHLAWVTRQVATFVGGA